MDPAPEAAPAPKTQPPESPPPSASSPPPSDDSPPPPPPPDDSPPPPPPPDDSPPPPSPPEDSEKTPPPAAPLPTPTNPKPSRKRRPSSTLSPPDVYPPRGSSSNRGKPGPDNNLPKDSSRKSPHKSPTDSDSITESATTTSLTIVAGIAAALVVFLALVIVCLLCNRKKKKPYYLDDSHEKPPGVPGAGPYYYGKPDHVVKFDSSNWGQSPPVNAGRASSGARMSGTSAFSLSFRSQFSYDELAAATGGFARYNILGQGGFGYVHKGVLPNGQEVAVKSLKAGSGQGEREFQAEVEIITRVHHRYLVTLVGYCICDAERMLVYEYVPNQTLEFHLHGKSQLVLDWQTRMRIALGSAKGLAYLHEDCHPRIIHRDIKSANILLDHEYEAKVADFGLAKLTSSNDTHVSTRVMGTFGYLAPEYASSGKLTDKSDVFSFGVMLLEILTGRKPVDPSNEMDDSLVDWAKPLIEKASEDGDYSELVDPRLKGDYDHKEMGRMASCAAAAVRHSARKRPKTSKIVRALEGDASLDSLSENATKGETRAYDTREYNDDMMKFRKMVMSSQEFETGEYSERSSLSLSNEIINPDLQR